MNAPLTYAPRLETDRLILRGPEHTDLAAFTSFVTGSPRMIAQGEQMTVADAWYAFLTGIGHWQWHGFGFFMVVLKEDTGAALGRVGLLRHATWPQEELAWHLFDGSEGKGYATEAARAVHRWAGETLGLTRLVSYIHKGNLKSQGVAKRLGSHTDGAVASHDEDAEIWYHAEVVA